MPVPPDWSQKLRTCLDEWQRNSLAEKFIGDQPFGNFLLTEEASSWDDFLAWLNELQGSWCFRGQREAAWLLHTSLDRETLREYSSGYDHLDREVEGRELLFRFRQQAHRYLKPLPPDADLSSWFALMQHHRVPTRFLDWTESPYVGLYFALEEEPANAEKRSAIWAIDQVWLERKCRQLLQSEPATPNLDEPMSRAEYLNSLLDRGGEGKPLIVRIDAQRSHERMAAQQGFFLCKLVHEATFNQMLMSMMYRDCPDRPVVRKLEVAVNHRIEFLKHLRSMNIHRASLFPGLDGFGESLRLNLEIKAKDHSPEGL